MNIAVGFCVAVIFCGTVYQASILGLPGILIAQSERLELNFLGLIIELNPLGPALKTPGIGRIGFDQD